MLIEIDFRDKRPIYEQIVGRIENLMIQGIIKPGDTIPSVRSLAMELSINPNTIQKAYSRLEKDGYIYSVSGRGSFASNISSLLPGKKQEVLDKLKDIVLEASDIGMEKDELIKYIGEM
ncbi:MAG: GntR family transcriptional regulator [Lachnospiraceae bacterium]|nr:GntR family transcriptional regulator [Lachnospiraceae bacterium]